MEWLLSLDEKERVYGCPSERWPEHATENLFPCWRCRDWKPWCYYNADMRENSHSSEVDSREGGYFKCCDICEADLCIKIIKKD